MFPLQLAAMVGNMASLEALLAHEGIKLDQTDAYGLTALYWAVQQNKPASVARLLKAGANVNLASDQHRWSPLIFAAMNGNTAVLEILVAHQGIALNQTDAYGFSALLRAADKNHPDAVTLLLKAGADVNLGLDASLATALIVASDLGHIEVVKALLACNRVALDQIDCQKMSALHWAARENKADVADCLLARGASMTIEDQDGHTVLQLALVFQHMEVIEVLMSYGAVLPALSFSTDLTDFDFTLSALVHNQRYPVDPDQNPLGLRVSTSLDQPIEFISAVINVLERKQGLPALMSSQGIRLACASPMVACLDTIPEAWMRLLKRGKMVTARLASLITAAALVRLPVPTGDSMILARYRAAGISAAGLERLSAVARGQAERIIALSTQVLTITGSAMLESLVQTCLENTDPTHQVKMDALSAGLVRAGWIVPLAESIAASWKSALVALESEAPNIPAGSALKQIPQMLSEHIQRKAPLHFAQAIKRELAGHALLAALRELIGDMKAPESLHMLFQIQCDQLRQYCEQVDAAG